MAENAARRPKRRFRRARRKVSRRRQGVPSSGQRRARAAAAGKAQDCPVRSRLQYDVRRGALPRGPDRPRCEGAGSPRALHLGVARNHPILRHQQRNRRARRTRAHAPPAARQQRRRGQRARPLDGQLGHGRGFPADQDLRQPRSRKQARLYLSGGARHRHRRVRIAAAPLRQNQEAVLCRARQGRQGAVALWNPRRRRQPGRRRPPRGRACDSSARP